LAKVQGIEWLRIHYAYPIGLPDDLLQTIADEPKVLPYLDMPLQHASGPMLKAMKRGVTRAGQERILTRVRAAIPDIAIRTTFIVGFPGETEDDFAVLEDFVREQRFSRVGVFTYFQEEGTPAADLPNQVPKEIRELRQARLMQVQAEISREVNEALVGQTVLVMLDGVSGESELLLSGRLMSQAPEVDGQVFVTSIPAGAKAGDVLPCRIVQAADYDLVGEMDLSEY
jgi:ribosomal protein S12 methylthiotransferase